MRKSPRETTVSALVYCEVLEENRDAGDLVRTTSMPVKTPSALHVTERQEESGRVRDAVQAIIQSVQRNGGQVMAVRSRRELPFGTTARKPDSSKPMHI